MHSVSAKTLLRSLAMVAACVPLAILPACAGAAAAAITLPEMDGALNALMLLSQQENAGDTKLATLRAAKLVRQAISQSPSVREARMIADAALRDVDYARAGKMPQVSIGAKSTVNTADAQSLLKSDGTPMATLNADMPVYDGGRVDAMVKGREAAVGSAMAIFAQRRQEAASDAVKACIDVERKQALQASAASYARNVEALVAMLKKIGDVDPGRASELVQARSRLLQAESSRQAAKAKVGEAQIQLERLVGAGHAGDCDSILPAFLQRPDLLAARDAAARSPAIVQIDEDYQQQLRAVDQIAASRKPQLRVAANYGPMNQGLNLYGATVALVASVVIYDGRGMESAERAAVDRAGSLIEKKGQALRQLDYDLQAAFEQADARWVTAREYTDLLKVNDIVRQNIFTQWMAMGRRTLFELLSTEAEQYSLQTNFVNALFDAASGFAAIQGKAALLPGLTEEEGK